MFPAIASTFGLAFFYFIGAIPAGVALGLPPAVTALTAWASYTAGVIIVALAGAPLRAWLIKRLRLSLEPDPSKLFWRIWERYGLVGLAALAPVTVGSQAAAAIGLTLGVPPARLIAFMAAGAAVWSAVIALLIGLGISAVGGG
jgi:hypothetical protein